MIAALLNSWGEFSAGTRYDAAVDDIARVEARDKVIDDLQAQVKRLEERLAEQPKKLVPIVYGPGGTQIQFHRDEARRAWYIDDCDVYDLENRRR